MIAGQKLPIVRPRMRYTRQCGEADLETYARLQSPDAMPQSVLKRLVRGVSCRDYEGVVDLARDGFGVQKSSVSRSFVKASAQEVRQLAERRFDGVRFPAIRLLGEWRVSDAAEMLVDQIEYSPREVVTRLGNPLSEFPAAEALVEIGSPAPQTIIDRMWKPVSDQQLKLYAFVLYMIDGRQLALARLEMALAKASEEAPRSAEYAKPKKENLSRLIRVLRDTDFSNRKERPRPPWVRRGGSAERED